MAVSFVRCLHFEATESWAGPGNEANEDDVMSSRYATFFFNCPFPFALSHMQQLLPKLLETVTKAGSIYTTSEGCFKRRECRNMTSGCWEASWIVRSSWLYPASRWLAMVFNKESKMTKACVRLHWLIYSVLTEPCTARVSTIHSTHAINDSLCFNTYTGKVNSLSAYRLPDL